MNEKKLFEKVLREGTWAFNESRANEAKTDLIIFKRQIDEWLKTCYDVVGDDQVFDDVGEAVIRLDRAAKRIALLMESKPRLIGHD